MKNFDLSKMKDCNSHNSESWTANGWERVYKLILVIFWIVIIAGGSYFWYQMFYGPGWSEAEKKAFLNAKFPDKSLNKDKLEKILERIRIREEKFNQDIFPSKNIFKKY